MKVKITDVGIPMPVVSGNVGCNIGFEYDGKHISTFITPKENLKMALYNAINKEEMKARNMVEAQEFAKEVKKLIGYEIDIP